MRQETIEARIEGWLKNEKKWKYSHDVQNHRFEMGVALRTGFRAYQVVINVKEQSYIVYIAPHVKCSEDRLPLMMRYLTLANFGLINGNFELDLNDGEIRYKTFVNCAGMDKIPMEVVDDSIMVACYTMQRYADGISRTMYAENQDESSINQSIANIEPWQSPIGRTRWRV